MDILKALVILKLILDQHNQEVIVLDFQHIYNFEDADHIYLTDMIRFIFGSKICPLLEDISQLTLQWIQENKFQVCNFELQYLKKKHSRFA